MEIFQNWKFDIRTAIITLVAIPLGYYLLRIILKYLKSWSGYLLEGAMYWISRSVKHSLAGALTLRRYSRLQLTSRSQYLHVPSSLDIKLDIDRVYVTLTLENLGHQQGSFSHIDLLTVGNRIRVIGDPGSGKSSLIKRVFRDACNSAIRSPLKSRLPILLELKNLEVPDDVDELGDWFYKEMQSITKKSAVYQMGECFDSYAVTAGLLVLLDGLDEVATRNYPKVQNAINQLSEKLSQLSDNNIIVVTMRTQFHQQIKDAYRDSFAQAMFLKAFSPSDIYEFLTRWPFQQNAEQHIPRIYKELTDRPTNSLEWSDAIRMIKKLMNCTENEAEAVFRDISKETGLITEERPRQSFRFIHLTFCEFLAAFEAVQGQDTGWANLINSHRTFQGLDQPQLQSRLIEVIPFACGLLPRIKRFEAIRNVADLGNSRLLALSFLETKLYNHPSWTVFVESEREHLLKAGGYAPSIQSEGADTSGGIVVAR